MRAPPKDHIHSYGAAATAGHCVHCPDRETETRGPRPHRIELYSFAISNIRECFESLLRDNRLMESVGVVCNDDNVAECAGDLCNLVGERISDPEEPPTAETLVGTGNEFVPCDNIAVQLLNIKELPDMMPA